MSKKTATSKAKAPTTQAQTSSTVGTAQPPSVEPQTPAVMAPGQAQVEACLASAFSPETGTFTVCIVNVGNVQEDGTFTSDKALTFASPEAALRNIDNIREHVLKAVAHQNRLAAFNEGVKAGVAQAQADASASPKAKASTKAKR